MDCIFCKIIKGELPSAKIYEDADTLAFLDIGPVNKGHALVIPKAHVEQFIDMDNEAAENLIVAVKKVVQAVLKGVGADGINVMTSNGEAAGQVVPHVHFHLIPRFKGDGFKFWPQGKYEEREMEEIAGKIRGEMLK